MAKITSMDTEKTTKYRDEPRPERVQRQRVSLGKLGKPDAMDVLFVAGIGMLFAGLYRLHGPGISLAVVGGIVTVAGLLGTGILRFRR